MNPRPVEPAHKPSSTSFKVKILLDRKTSQATKLFLILLRETKTSSAHLAKAQKKKPSKSSPF